MARSEAAGQINLGNRTGSVAPGDVVFVGGKLATVRKVYTVAGGIGTVRKDWDGMTLVVETDNPGAPDRFIGVHAAWIDSDLRMYWERNA